MAGLGLGLSAGSVVWTAILIGAYALLVNAFYQILSKRVMFATKAEVKATEELNNAMEAADAARHEAERALEVAVEDPAISTDQAAVVAEAAVETQGAIAQAQDAIAQEAAWGWRSITRNTMYFALVPVVIFGFFILLSGALLFLTAGTQTVTSVFGLALAVILAVRITAYISEATSHDIAKMLPLALLGFFLVDGGFASAGSGFDELKNLGSQWLQVLGFLAVIVIAEFALRLVYFVVRRLQQTKWLEQQKEEPPIAVDAVTPKQP